MICRSTNKFVGVKEHQVCNLLSNGSEKKIYLYTYIEKDITNVLKCLMFWESEGRVCGNSMYYSCNF